MQQVMAWVLAFAMVLTGTYTDGLRVKADGNEAKVLNIAGMSTRAGGTAATQKVDDTFSLVFTADANSKVDTTTNKKWSDQWAPTGNFGRLRIPEKVAISSATAVQITTKAAATVKVWWISGGTDRQVQLIDSAGTSVDISAEENVASNTTYLSTLDITTGGTYYLGCNKRSTIYICKVEVTEEGSNTPTKDVKATVTVSDGDALLQESDKIRLAAGSTDGVDIDYNAKGQEVTLKSETSYNITCTNEDVTVKTDDDKSVVKLTDDGAVTLVVSSAVVKPTVKITDANKLLADQAGKKITLTAGNSVIDLTDGATPKLRIGTKYTLATDAEGVVVKIDGKKEFTPTADTKEIEVVVTPSGKEILAKINDPDNLLNGAKVVLTATIDDEVQTVELTDNQKAALVLDAVYRVSTTAENVYTKINGSIVLQPKESMEEFTVDVTAPIKDVYELDLTKDLVAETVYSGGVSVLETMAHKPQPPAEANGVIYADLVAGSHDPKCDDDKAANGRVPTSGAALKIVPEKDGKITIVYKKVTGKNFYAISVDASGDISKIADGTGQLANADYYELEMTKGLTYYIYGSGTKINFYAIKTDYRSQKDRGPWANVAAPVITGAAQDSENAANIKVTVTGAVDGFDNADALEVDMLDAKGNRVDAKRSTATATTHEFSFTPTASGDYTFVARLVRTGEENKASASEPPTVVKFVLPLSAPAIKVLTSIGVGADGLGQAKVDWEKVPEATGYVLTAAKKVAEGGEAATPITTDVSGGDVTTATVGGLEVGATYEISMIAKRGEEKSAASETKEIEITAAFKQSWEFTAYGSNASLNKEIKKGDNLRGSGLDANDPEFDTKVKKADGTTKKVNDYEIHEDGSVSVWSIGTNGKVVPKSTDGLAFYYTAVPTSQNFKLSAHVKVDSWCYTNGQEGFGLLAADRIGNEDVAFWNNSYMLGFTKVEYYWNEGAVATEGEKVNMYIGPGALSKIGVTPENLANFTQDPADGTITMTQSEATNAYFKYATKTLDTTAASRGGGTYNLVANCENADSAAIEDNSFNYNDFDVTLERNNTGYFLTYSRDGKTMTQKYYIPDALDHLDKDYVYVGMFASRAATATFSDIQLTLSDPATDPAPEPEPVTYYTPTFNVTSANVSNTEDYEFKFSGNWAGTLTVKDAAGNAVIDGFKLPTYDEAAKIIYAPSTYKLTTEETQAGYKLVTAVSKTTKLNVGDNVFSVVFAPDKDWHPNVNDDEAANQLLQLRDYSASNFTHNVSYKAYGESGTALYVAPDGSASGTGRKSNPLDIYTAVKYVQPGQSIILAGGTYNLTQPIRVERGINGTADKMIYLIADQDAVGDNRPVIDFGGVCTGITFGGDYWFISGFDVTGSADGQKGIQVSGSHNVLENLNTYMNGNTGIQIARLYGTDSWDDWPSYNTIRNCNSYLNSDAGFEDADGFAAKLTIGDGNVFDGCVAAYNADDGWDLYAKVETGAIGKVVIKNSITFKNGYLLVDDEGKLSVNGTKEISAGNGNGFKMGGESISGKHELRNSYAFYNKAKGIDSNSCPDIQVFNSISFNNQKYNVAFYTNTATQTNFAANGLISYKTAEYLKDESVDKVEDIIPVGTQRQEAWLIASEKVRNAELIAAYNAITNSNSKSKFGKASSKWPLAIENGEVKVVDGQYNKDETFKAFVDKAEELGLSDLDKEICIKYMDGIAAFAKAYDTPDKIAEAEAALKAGNPIFGKNNYYIFNGKTQNAVDTDVIVGDDWFESVDVGSFATVVKREADGKPVLQNGFLQLTEKAKNANASLGDFGLKADASTDVNNATDIPKTETDGSVTGGLGSDGSGVVSGDKPANGGDMVGLWVAFVDGTSEYTYTGSAIKPEIRVYYDMTRLTSKDYSISYKNNINVPAATQDANDMSKAPTIKVTGKGNFEGFVDQYFTIKPVDLTDALSDKGAVTASEVYVAYKAGKAQKPVPVLNYNGKKLAKNKDFDVTYPSAGDYTAAGNYEILVTGKGNYANTVRIPLHIVEPGSLKDLSKAKINIKDNAITFMKKSFVYNGSAIEPAVDVVVGGSTQAADSYKLTYRNNKNVGTASIVVEGIPEKGTFGSKTQTFKITPANLSQSNLKAKDYKSLGEDSWTTASRWNVQIKSPSYLKAVGNDGKGVITYAGETVVFTDLDVIVHSTAGGTATGAVTLREGKDYTITYTGNAKAGTASFTIKGKGNYTGSTKGTFKIQAYNIQTGNGVGGNIVDSDHWKDLKIAYEVGGAKPTISMTVNGITQKEGKDYTVSYKNNSKAGSNNATVTVIGKGGLTGRLTQSFAVEKKDLSDSNMPLSLVANDIVYKNKAGKPKTTAKLYNVNNKVVSSGEYTLKYYVNYGKADEKEVTTDATFKPAKNDTITVVAEGKGKNYTGKITDEVRVIGADIKSAKVKAFDLKYYTGSSITLMNEDFNYVDPKDGKTKSRITLKNQELVINQDFRIVSGSYESNVKAGTAKFAIEGIGEYGGTKVVTFKINKRVFNVGKAVCTINKSATDIKDQLVVRLNNQVLKYGVDYRLNTTQYSSKNTVTIIGMNGYGGVKSVKIATLKEEPKTTE
ncbi:MAG: hypothetical protein NC092_04910 [Butyrivibrio sp.]|nr:hypothetical protein [Muribaculum sp.]MCM1552013.1 hypothetical protein [Butyrivibrio sp.]